MSGAAEILSLGLGDGGGFVPVQPVSSAKASASPVLVAVVIFMSVIEYSKIVVCCIPCRVHGVAHIVRNRLDV